MYQLVACVTTYNLSEYQSSNAELICWIRISHAGGGIPEGLLNQMFGTDGDISEEGISLLISRKLVKLMNGDVQYLREAGKSTFIISAELAAAHMIRS